MFIAAGRPYLTAAQLKAKEAGEMDGVFYRGFKVPVYRDTYGLYGEAGQVQMINSYSLRQEEPRRMPTFFMVAPGSEG